MAYMSQERKAQIVPAVKSILKRYGIKGSLAVRGGSTLVLNIKSGTLDFINDYNETVAAPAPATATALSTIANGYAPSQKQEASRER